MRYAIVIEKAEKNYSAYVPDLPGCTTTGDTVHEVLKNMHEAIALHLEGMVEDGATVPNPDTLVDYIDSPIPVLELAGK